MGSACSSQTATPSAPPPRTARRQLTAFVGDDEQEMFAPAVVHRLRSESLKEEDLKKNVATLKELEESRSNSPRPFQRQESARRVKFPKQDLVRVYEYTPDALLK